MHVNAKNTSARLVFFEIDMLVLRVSGFHYALISVSGEYECIVEGVKKRIVSHNIVAGLDTEKTAQKNCVLKTQFF